MVTKKSDIQNKGAAEKPAAPAKTNQLKTPKAETSPDAGQAAVIADLVRGGMSYTQAVAAMAGGGAPDKITNAPLPKINVGKDPGADEVIDPDSIEDVPEDLETYRIDHTPREGYKVIEELYELRQILK